MKKRMMYALLCVITVTTFACKKDASNSSSNSKNTLLTSGTWTFQKYEYQQKNGTWIPDPDAADADKFTIGFNANNSFSQLDLVNNYSATGGWNFSSDYSQLTLTGGEDYVAGAYTVSQLTSSTLQLTNPNYSSSSAIYIAERLTFTH